MVIFLYLNDLAFIRLYEKVVKIYLLHEGIRFRKVLYRYITGKLYFTEIRKKKLFFSFFSFFSKRTAFLYITTLMRSTCVRTHYIQRHFSKTLYECHTCLHLKTFDLTI